MENGGVSSALNCGIVNSQNELIVTHTCDYIPPHEWLKNLYEAWQKGKFDFISLGIKYVVADVDESSPLYDFDDLDDVQLSGIFQD